jgi:RHS repeat-associated protein
MVANNRVALIESRIRGNDNSPARISRYQFHNLISSSSLELDDQAQILSYEEYFPYGSTSYQAVRSQLDTPKRYRFTGKERDEESGLSYHGARYYASWIGRWLSPDPGGIKDGPNVFAYSSSNPVKNVDPTGFVTEPAQITINYAVGRIYQNAGKIIMQSAFGPTVKILSEKYTYGRKFRVDEVVRGVKAYVTEWKAVEMAKGLDRLKLQVERDVAKAVEVTKNIRAGVAAGKLPNLTVEREGVKEALAVKKVIYIIKGAEDSATFRKAVVVAKAAGKANAEFKAMGGMVHVLSENAPRVQKALEAAKLAAKGASWFEKAKPFISAGGKVLGGALAGVAVVGAAFNLATALDSSQSTGTRAVAALNVVATAAAFLPIPGAALVAGAVGIGLAFGGSKLAAWIDGPKHDAPAQAPTPAPASPEPMILADPAPASHMAAEPNMSVMTPEPNMSIQPKEEKPLSNS